MYRNSLWFVLLFCAGAAFAQRPVIVTESAQPLGARHLRTGVGVEYLEKHQAPARDYPEKEFRAFVANMNFGVAENVDFNLEWLGGIVATFPGGSKGYDWGDLTVATKIMIIGDTAGFPLLGIRSAVKLPNTSYVPYKLGSNATDFFFQALVGGKFGAFETRLNLGFGIIGAPTAAGVQNDVYTFSAACVASLGKDANAFAEIIGAKGYIRGDGKFVARAGTAVKWQGVEWNVFGSLRVMGDNRDFATAFDLSENWSIGVFLRKDICW